MTDDFEKSPNTEHTPVIHREKGGGHRGRSKFYSVHGDTYLIYCVVAALSYWMFPAFDLFAHQLQCLNLESSGASALKLTSAKPLVEYELDYLGSYLLYFFAVIGSLNWLNKKNRSFFRFNIIACILPFVVIAYSTWIMGISTLLPHRWLSYAAIFMVFPAASILKDILKLSETRPKLITISIILFVMNFLMISNTITNGDSPLYGEENTVRLGLKESECESAEFVNSYSQKLIYTDWLLHFYFMYHLNIPLKQERMRLIDDDVVKTMEERDAIFVMRRYIYNRPIQRPTYKLEMKYLEKIPLKVIERIYDNGEVVVYQTKQ